MPQNNRPKWWLCSGEWGAFIAKSQKKIDEIKEYDPDGEETIIISEIEEDYSHFLECGGQFYGFDVKRCEKCGMEIKMDLSSNVIYLHGAIYRKVGAS